MDSLPRGRGASANPPNRFEKLHIEPDPEAPGLEEDGVSSPRTEFLKDSSRSVIATNESPDVGFEASLNPYRGCEHGCIYCYARPTHEVLGFSAGLDFESRILVKEDAPELLRRELLSPRWKPQAIALSGVTDPYQPVERRLKLTRRCLEVLAEFLNPVAVVTKNHLVTRDADLLGVLAQHSAAAVFVSVTTLDGDLARVLEPRASAIGQRLKAVAELSQAGVPTGVMVAPVIPGINDHEIPAILEAASSAGARFAGYVPVRLPYAVAPLFESWLEQHFPLRKSKVLNQIRAMRGGRLNDPRFGSRMRGEGVLADGVRALFAAAYRKAGLGKGPPLSTESFRRPTAQLSLFE